jgi:phosphotransferase system enzyme I (PtsI)
MVQFRGVGIGRGRAVGTVVRMADPLPDPLDVASTLTPEAERARAHAALATTATDIRSRGQRAGGAAKDVLEAQAMMAEDPSLHEHIESRIAEGATAERAVFDAFASFRDLLTSVGGRSAERAADLSDLSQRTVAHLRGAAVPGVPSPGHPFVPVARALAPADTATLDLESVVAFVTVEGGPTSHTAIVARERSIVAVVGAPAAGELADGQTVIVDAASGTVTADPTAADLSQDAGTAGGVRHATAMAGALADGTAIPLFANLSGLDGIAEALELGAEGVGLFRTEFLFLDAVTPPSVAEQRSRYAELFTAFAGKTVVVRVLDAGADKPLTFLHGGREDNPALGLRGLRLLRANEQVLRDQLAAIAGAASTSDADVWLMAPMVSTVEEARYFSGLAREAGLPRVGVTIEVPAAALLADRILAELDFASVGTNDLTQYTLAADRMLGSVAPFHDPWHPAVLRLIGEVGRAGAALGKPVGVCGEAAADPLLAVVLVGLGATSLSMAPAALEDVRAKLRQFTLTEARALAELALSADGADEARDAVTRA